jgi:pSer/pThr/pTyr-binding forkhead associated (FHA) protein
VLPNGTALQIPPGLSEVMIGREDPVSNIFPQIDLETHDGLNNGVGRTHAKLIVQGGQVHVVDLSSVNGTWVNTQKLAPNQPYPLNNGDELRVGKMKTRYYSQ